MLLSTRQVPPRISLRRNPPSFSSSNAASPSYNEFAFSRMIDSPPVSPGLPPPRHTSPSYSKTSLHRRYANVVRFVLWLCGVGVILSFVSSILRSDKAPPAQSYKSADGDVYELVGDDALPDHPSPVMVTDRRGRSKWTMSIPPTHEFPLHPQAYADMCSRSAEVASHVADIKSHTRTSPHHAGHYGYYHHDKNYMDVEEAERHGMLPKTEGKEDEIRGCEKSMTYVMETTDAGLGKSLMGLWMAYGLAEKEGRAFFLDDSRWPYGRFTTYFASPPPPACRAPPRTQIVPCPHTARHIVVSAATTSWTFGHAFNEEYQDPKGMEVQRQKHIFALARAGYEALFHLKPEDEEYVSRRVAQFTSQTLSPKSTQSSGMLVGMHVRRGDLHPLEFQYSNNYIPLYRYASAAKTTLSAMYNSSSKHARMTRSEFESASKIFVATDDPEIYGAEELGGEGVVRAQDRIQLATKSALDAARQSTDTGASATGGVGSKFVDETIGWEGGFFKDIFWSLGSARKATAAATEREMVDPTDQALRLRELVGKAYLLDLKVVGEGADAVVCGVSATGCNLLAVMMGWEKAIGSGRWVNVDGEFGWRGVSW